MLELLKTAAYREFKNFLDEQRFTYYLGGSRRFKYHRSQSDFDIFILDERDVERDIEHSLISLGFKSDNKNHHNYPAGNKLYSYYDMIHAILLKPEMFKHNCTQHNNVEEFLDKHPFMLPVCKYLKAHLPGKQIYNMLVRAELSSRKG